MDILKRIKELQAERGWTLYKLSEEAAINRSTLDNMFQRQTMPSMTTLIAICEAFDMTLSQFFCDTEEIYLTEEETALVSEYRKLDKKNKKVISTMINELNK